MSDYDKLQKKFYET